MVRRNRALSTPAIWLVVWCVLALGRSIGSPGQTSTAAWAAKRAGFAGPVERRGMVPKREQARPRRALRQAPKRVGDAPKAPSIADATTPTQPAAPRSATRNAVHAVGRGVDRLARTIESLGERLEAPRARAFARKLSRILSYALGEQTLINTSFRFGVGLGASLPGALASIGGVGGAVNYWTGSVRYYEDHVPQNGKSMHINAGAGVSTVVYSASYDRRREWTHSLGISLFSGAVSPRRFAISSGIPLLFGVALGEEQGVKEGDFDKGSFFRVTGRVFPFVNVTGEIYYPPLERVTKRLRPLAVKARDFNERVGAWMDRKLGWMVPAWLRKVTTKEEPVDPAEPTAPVARAAPAAQARSEPPLGPMAAHLWRGSTTFGFA